jgi:hypothetical protein
MIDRLVSPVHSGLFQYMDPAPQNISEWADDDARSEIVIIGTIAVGLLPSDPDNALSQHGTGYMV